MTDIVQAAKPDIVDVFRHVRHKDARGNITSRGGVTFLFRINYPQNSIEFSFALCHPKDNFDHSKANSIAVNRFNGGVTLIGEYNRNVPLVENAYQILEEHAHQQNELRGIDAIDLFNLQDQLDFAFGRGAYDPAYTEVTFHARLPVGAVAEFQDAVQAAIQKISKKYEQFTAIDANSESPEA